MPEGYEDVKNLQDLRKCKEELDSSTQKQTRKASDVEQDKCKDWPVHTGSDSLEDTDQWSTSTDILDMSYADWAW
jgi:hypothetical protein